MESAIVVVICIILIAGAVYSISLLHKEPEKIDFFVVHPMIITDKETGKKHFVSVMLRESERKKILEDQLNQNRSSQ